MESWVGSNIMIVFVVVVVLFTVFVIVLFCILLLLIQHMYIIFLVIYIYIVSHHNICIIFLNMLPSIFFSLNLENVGECCGVQ